MDGSDWIALTAVVVAVLSGGGAIKYARRSAVHSQRSADHAGESVVEARRAADEAARLTRIEEERRVEERARWHHEREPDLPGEIDLEYRDSPGGSPGDGALWGTVTFPHTYQVRAFTVAGSSWSPLSLDSVTQPGRPVEFMVERWPRGKEALHTDEVVFRFWPPAVAEDGTAVWRCGCGHSVQATEEGQGHWERRVKVRYVQPWASIH